MNDMFTCDNCHMEYPDRYLTRRETCIGQYCPECGHQEKCAACGEFHSKGFMIWKDNIRNYVCEDCQHDYQSVAQYIKPLTLKAA